MRYNYAAEARDEHLTKLDNALYIIIALVNIKTRKYLSKTNEVRSKARDWKKNTQSLRFFWYIIVIITVIWLSVKYQNFFCFQNVTSPPHAVNVPFISSHIKVSRSSLEPNLSICSFSFHVAFFLFCFVLFSFRRICDLCFSQKCWKSVYS